MIGEIMNIEMDEKMAIDSHRRGSEEDHSRRKMKKEDAKANEWRMSQEKIDKEIAELKEQLDALRRILEESQRLGWVLRKKPVKCHKLQRRLQQRHIRWLREKLKEAELEMKMEVSICEADRVKF